MNGVNVNPSAGPVPYSKLIAVASKIKETVKAIATPIFLILGAVFTGLYYAVPLKAFLATALAPFNVIGITLLALGSLLYLKSLWDTTKAAQKLKTEEKLNEVQASEIVRLNDVLTEKFKFSKLNEEFNSNAIKLRDETIDQLTNDFTELEAGFEKLNHVFEKLGWIEINVQGETFYINSQKMIKGSVKQVCLGFSPERECHVAISFNPKEHFVLTQEIVTAWNDWKDLCKSDIFAFEDFEDQQILVQPWYNYKTLSKSLSKLTSEQKLHVVNDLLRGYSSLHEKGLIHGDPKLGNIMLDEQDGLLYTRLVDLDLVAFADKSSKIGAKSYCAPELLWSLEPGSLDRPKAEVWSVGLMIAMVLIEDTVIIDKLGHLLSDLDENTTIRDHLSSKIAEIKNADFEDVHLDDFHELLESWKDIELSSEFDQFNPLLEKMLAVDSDKRCTMAEAYKLFLKLKKM